MRIITQFLLVTTSVCYLSASEVKDVGETLPGKKKAREMSIRDYQQMDLLALEYLGYAVQIFEGKLKFMKFFRKHYLVEESALKLDPYRFTSDVIQHFKIMKRFVHDWDEMFKVVKDNQIPDLDKQYEKKVKKYDWPSDERLREVVENYLDFQKKKKLSAKALADQKFAGAKHETKLRSSDCHAIAAHLIYDPKRQSLALEWLKEAYARFHEKNETERYKQDLLLDLAFTLSETGHTKEAVDFAENFTRTNMKNGYIYADMHKYLKARLENRPVQDLKKNTTPEDTTLDLPLYPDLRHWHLADVCKGNARLPPSYVAKLKCRYTINDSPLFVLSPLREEELYLDPKVSIYRNFLTDGEVDGLIDSAYGRMNDAKVRQGPSESNRSTDYRQSKVFFLDGRTPKFERFLKRTDALTGLGNETAEPVQLSYYDAGGWYTSHYDAFPNDFELRNGNRIATVLFYLNDVKVGGETAFYHLNVAAEPEKGSALVWFNLKRSGLTNMLSGHGACPVLYGHKWIATRWFHHRGQMLKRPCTLNKYE
nr:PREDICTED: prolyl 4-hydroxylase subunit alpha-1-like [Bemisia tabaci]